jgi:GrpB-like predicted nucleotidyltransferase (UPF0157 family)
LSDDAIIVIPYDPAWRDLFVESAGPMREALGDVALRIDHIGSTSIPGIAAKPIVDILISVATFEPFDKIEKPLNSVGYVWRPENTDKSKRYFREMEGMRRTHLHVHLNGSWGQQFVLLFRDYLRQHPEDRRRYEAVKYALAKKYRYGERLKYVEGKSPIIWEIMQRANQWSQDVGWQPGHSDI